MYVLDQNRRQMALTVQAVAEAVDSVFGEQIAWWKSLMDHCQNYSEVTVI
jgi:hypothetical protein